jgi:NAD(P)H dehydrogenase (quinone)
LSAHLLRDGGCGAVPEATVIAAAAARERGNVEVSVNISQMTVSHISLTNMMDSPQQRRHWLAEQVLNWSALPVVHVRPTVFSGVWPRNQSQKTTDTIRLPFGAGRTSLIAAEDVDEVIATILASPTGHMDSVYQLTGPKSQNMTEVAMEYSATLRRDIRYVDVAFDQWREPSYESSSCRTRLRALTHNGPSTWRQPV